MSKVIKVMLYCCHYLYKNDMTVPGSVSGDNVCCVFLKADVVTWEAGTIQRVTNIVSVTTRNIQLPFGSFREVVRISSSLSTKR